MESFADLPLLVELRVVAVLARKDGINVRHVGVLPNLMASTLAIYAEPRPLQVRPQLS